MERQLKVDVPALWIRNYG